MFLTLSVGAVHTHLTLIIGELQQLNFRSRVLRGGAGVRGSRVRACPVCCAAPVRPASVLSSALLGIRC